MLNNLHYFWYLCRHKYFVAVAGRQIGVSWWQLLIHDYSKFSPAEWGAYRRRFFAGRSGTLDKANDPIEFHRAWTHHWHNNPHHWEYHLRVVDASPAIRFDLAHGLSQLGPMPMPEKYVKEMVADWCGASRAITGGWNAATWYKGKRGQINLFPETRTLVELHLSLADLKLNGKKKSKWVDV